MEEFERAAALLPDALRTAILQVRPDIRCRVQEIRLRVNAPLTLSCPDGEQMLTNDGQVSMRVRPDLLLCTREQVEACYQQVCEYSVHSHQQEIRNGYISTRSGCRVGLAGSVVVENGEILSMRTITSLCIRVARQHVGCAAELARALTRSGTVESALLCGEPSSGKSSLLRDLARQLAGGVQGRRYRVAVVDERGELSAEQGLTGCDVLLYCPKGAGVQQAVRCLAPDVVLFDELGTVEEVEAVRAGLHSGVAAIATAHGRDQDTLLQRPPVCAALREGLFSKAVLLAGRREPGRIREIAEVGDWLGEDRGSAAHCAGGSGTWHIRLSGA